MKKEKQLKLLEEAQVSSIVKANIKRHIVSGENMLINTKFKPSDPKCKLIDYTETYTTILKDLDIKFTIKETDLNTVITLKK